MSSTIETNPPSEIEVEPVPPIELIELWNQMAEAAPEDGAKALRFCALQLQLWVRKEGGTAWCCMPFSIYNMITTALHFDSDDKDSWKALAHAAKAMQTGTI